MTDFLRRFTVASYIVALIFIFTPVVDAATNAWPWLPSIEQWRFGAVGILSNYLISITFGLLLLGALGAAREARGTLYFVVGASGLLAILLFVITISYTFDTLQVWGSVREEQVEMFQIGAAKTLFKIVLFFIGSVAIAIASWRTAKDTTTSGRAR